MNTDFYKNIIKEKRKQNKYQSNLIENDIINIIKSIIPEYNTNEFTLGDWDCEDSPIGLCIYNHIEDSCLDNCLYCGGPDERK